MAHICTTRLSCHAEVNFTLVSMGDDVMCSRSMGILYMRISTWQTKPVVNSSWHLHVNKARMKAFESRTS